MSYIALGLTAVSTNLIPNADNTYDIGSASKRWKDIYMAGVLHNDAATPSSGKGMLLGATSLDADVTAVGNSCNWAVGAGTLSGNSQYAAIQNGVNAVAGSFLGFKTRSTGTDANTVLSANDQILAITAFGADGASYRTAASITFGVDGTPSAGVMPGILGLWTTPNSSTTLARRWYVDRDGQFNQDVTSGSDLVFNKASSIVRLGTSDAADNKLLYLCGGGGNTATRGAVIKLAGNESGSPGVIDMLLGDIGGEFWRVIDGNGGYLRYDRNGTATLGGVSGNGAFVFAGVTAPVLRTDSVDTADNRTLLLLSYNGTTLDRTRGASIELAGNESSDLGQVYIQAGAGTAGGNIFMRLGIANASMFIQDSSSSTLWAFNTDGTVNQNSSGGSNIVFNKANTGLLMSGTGTLKIVGSASAGVGIIYDAANSTGAHAFRINSGGVFQIQTTGVALQNSAAYGFRCEVAGQGVLIKEGTNATMGTGTLNGTTEVTISTTKVTASSRIFLSIQAPGGTPAGNIYVSSRSAGTSFGVKGTALDTSTFAWLIMEPL